MTLALSCGDCFPFCCTIRLFCWPLVSSCGDCITCQFFCLPNLLAVLYWGEDPTYFFVPLAFGWLSLNRTALSSGPLDSLDGHSLAICCGLPQVKQLVLCSAPLSILHSIFLIPDVRSETLLQRVDISSDTLDICLATSVNPGVLVPDCGNSFLGIRPESVL